MALSKVQSVDQRMRLGMRCRLSPTADVPSHTSGAAMCHKADHSAFELGLLIADLYQHIRSVPDQDLGSKGKSMSSVGSNRGYQEQAPWEECS